MHNSRFPKTINHYIELQFFIKDVNLCELKMRVLWAKTEEKYCCIRQQTGGLR